MTHFRKIMELSNDQFTAVFLTQTRGLIALKFNHRRRVYLGKVAKFFESCVDT